MSQWFLKKQEGRIFGPVNLSTLRVWAANGQVEPGDKVSQDKADWIEPQAVQTLELHYSVLQDDGSPYGPLHLLALRVLLQEQSIRTTTPVVRTDTHETRSAADWLFPHFNHLHEELVMEIKQLRQQVEAQALQIAQMKEPAAEEEQTGALQELHATVEALQAEIQKQQSERTEWTSAHDTLKASEQQLQARIVELEQQHQDQCKALTDELAQHQQEAKQDTELLEAHTRLKEHCDYLTGQLEEKNQTIATLERGPDEGEGAALRARIEQLEIDLKEEREKKLEQEKAHLDLIKSFRELNDRYISMRQKKPIPAKSMQDNVPANPFMKHEETASGAPQRKIRLT